MLSAVPVPFLPHGSFEFSHFIDGEIETLSIKGRGRVKTLGLVPSTTEPRVSLGTQLVH